MIDEIAVQRLMAGDPMDGPRRRADGVEALRRLAAAGWSDGQIALRLGRTRRQILRQRARYGIPTTVTPGVGHGVPGVPTRPVALR